MLAVATVVNSVIATIVNTMPNRKLIGYRYRDQLADLLPNLLITVVMGVVVYFVNYLPMGAFWTLVLQVAVGVAVYVLLSLTTRNPNFFYLIKAVKRYFLKKE